MKKKIMIALCSLVILGLLWVALMPSPVPVSVTEVERGYFAEFVEDEGYTSLRFTDVVTAPINGFLRRVDLEPGDWVRPGDLLFMIEPSPAPALDPRNMAQARENLDAARARVAAARSDLEERKHEADFAQKEWDRHVRLFEREAISKATLDRAQKERDSSLAAKRAAEAVLEAVFYEMENARAVLAVASGERTGDKRILAVKSSKEGLVLRRERYHEGVVQAGEVLLELGSLKDLEVRVDLLSSEAVRVLPGMRVILEHWGGKGKLEGRVRRVEPSGFMRVSALGVDEQRVPVFVVFDSPWEERKQLGDGYRVEARFILWDNDEVVQIPINAIFREKDVSQVFVVKKGRAVRRTVETGRRSGLMVQVLSGLEPGETVINHPGDRIKAGVRVKVP